MFRITFSTELTKAQAAVFLSVKCPPLYVRRCAICKSCMKWRCIVTHLSLSCIFLPSLLAVFACLCITHILDDPSTPEREQLRLPGLCATSLAGLKPAVQNPQEHSSSRWGKQGAAKTLKVIRGTSGSISFWQDQEVCALKRDFEEFIEEAKKTKIRFFPLYRSVWQTAIICSRVKHNVIIIAPFFFHAQYCKQCRKNCTEH